MKGSIIYYGGFALPDKNAAANRVVSNGKLFDSLGYKTIFWSIAYVDWYKDKSFGKDYVLKNVIANLHDGAICLMHSVSSSNQEALSTVIDKITNEGYTFKTVDSL